MNSRRPVNSDVMRLWGSSIENTPKLISGMGAFLGSIVLAAGLYVFINRIVFLAHASSSSATIVSVSHEWVSKGKGGVLAYVPTVSVMGPDGRILDIKIDTFSEEPVYAIGHELAVSCNPTRGCIENTFFSKWGACIIDLLISVVCFLPLLVYKLGLWQSDSDDITELNLQRDA